MSQRRGRPARLSHETVVEAALGLLEEGGLESVTMTAVAAAVDSSPMGLYRHVNGREDLVESPGRAPWGLLVVMLSIGGTENPA
jgi:AcrR family transcriptional regulator